MFLTNARYRRIVLFFAGVTLNILFWDLLLRRVGLERLGERSRERRYLSFAKAYRRLAVDLGGVLIKVGQFLSARVDVLPEYITAELSGLQDEVPAAPFDAVLTRLEAELGLNWRERFDTFDKAPLAAASLGQTYRARLHEGGAVVVKVQRPGIDAIVETDLAALTTVAQWLKRYDPIRKRADIEALLREFAVVLREELDYVREAGNARRFAELFADDPGVVIPKAYPELGTARVLVLEDVGHIKITDYDAITAAGVDRAAVAERLFKTYLTQIFTHRFFHADPHPGNLFVAPAEGEHAWRLVFIDFGMVGEITPTIREAIREAVIAVGTRDPARLIRSFQAVDALLPGADLDRIAAAQQAVFDRYWGRSMSELRAVDRREVREFMSQFRDLLFELPFQVPENLIYLGRTVAILSGMCTGLDPNFNLFIAITPFAEKLLAEETQGNRLEGWIDEILDQLRRLALLPARLDAVLGKFERGELTVTIRHAPDTRNTGPDLPSAVRGLSNSLVVIGLVAAGTLLYLNAQPTLGIAGWALAGVVWVLGVVRR